MEARGSNLWESERRELRGVRLFESRLVEGCAEFDSQGYH